MLARASINQPAPYPFLVLLQVFISAPTRENLSVHPYICFTRSQGHILYCRVSRLYSTHVELSTQNTGEQDVEYFHQKIQQCLHLNYVFLCVGVLFKTEKWNWCFGRRGKDKTIAHHLKLVRKEMCVCLLVAFFSDDWYFDQYQWIRRYYLHVQPDWLTLFSIIPSILY